MVSGETRRPLRTGTDLAWPTYMAGLRTRCMGSRGADDGARTALFLHLASLFCRSQNRLLEGDAHTRRIHSGANPWRHAAGGHRAGLRQDPKRPPRRGIPQERRRMGAANGEHRETCRTNVVIAWPISGKLAHPCLGRWVTKRGCCWLRSYVVGGLVRYLNLRVVPDWPGRR